MTTPIHKITRTGFRETVDKIQLLAELLSWSWPVFAHILLISATAESSEPGRQYAAIQPVATMPHNQRRSLAEHADLSWKSEKSHIAASSLHPQPQHRPEEFKKIIFIKHGVFKTDHVEARNKYIVSQEAQKSCHRPAQRWRTANA